MLSLGIGVCLLELEGAGRDRCINERAVQMADAGRWEQIRPALAAFFPPPQHPDPARLIQIQIGASFRLDATSGGLVCQTA